jgi:hypothetical protein
MGGDGPAVTARLPVRANLRGDSAGTEGGAEMIRKHFRFKRLVLGLAFSLVFAGLAAPTAMAKPVNSNVLNGGLDPWAVSLVYNSTHPSTTQSIAPSSLDAWAVNLVDKAARQSAPKAVDLGPLDPWAYNLVY